MSKPKRPKRPAIDWAKFPNIARAHRLAFLFRRDLAKRLAGDDGLLASAIYSAIGGGPDCENNINTLTMWFHADAAQRRDAARRCVAHIGFTAESEARQREFAGDARWAQILRKEEPKMRAFLESHFGTLAQGQTIDGTAEPDDLASAGTMPVTVPRGS